ncbi:type VI secretion system baseplate subunit TssF [Pantoea agglomerans]|uniref:type VI secretion system baseplate subunit TssF n=1 Tax=Enterobacter agglomerans TaxID=549 RepID=UPI00301CFBB0
MNNKMIDYYNRELEYFRELSGEFAKLYPGVAGNLGFDSNGTSDPYVERLLEGVAFLTSRVQIKMDSEFPRFTERLLDMVYPNYLALTPSVAIAKLTPDQNKGGIKHNYMVPRKTFIQYQNLTEQGITVGYTTTQDVKLHPIILKTVTANNLLSHDLIDKTRTDAVACLQFQLETFATTNLGYCDIDDITFYISGPDSVSQPILELILEHNVGIVCEVGDNSMYLNSENLSHEGFAPDQALLPSDLRNFDGYRFLQEYFTLPAKFMFFKIKGLSKILREGNEQKRFKITILLDKNITFKDQIITANFHLHCTPIINLFPKLAGRIDVDNKSKDFHIVVDKAHPLDYEVFSVQELHGSNDTEEYKIFKPFWGTYSRDNSNYGAYFSTRREPRVMSQQVSIYGSRTNYAGSEVFVSLVDEHDAPWGGGLKYITADVLCTNRDLPLLITESHYKNFVISDSLPVHEVTFLTQPTAPKASMADGMQTWWLISQLQINYLTLMDVNADKGAMALREILHIYAGNNNISVKNQIESILHANFSSVARKTESHGKAIYSRGVSIELEINEESYAGSGAWLIGSVLAHFFSRLVTINSFTDLTIISKQRGIIGHWSGYKGKREII